MFTYRKNSAVIFAVLLIGVFEIISITGCKYVFRTDFPDKESVLLWDFDTLIEPTDDGIEMASSQPFIIACPGSRNVVTKTNTPYVTVQCSTENKVKISGVEFPLSDLGCNISVTGEFEATTTSCGAGRGVIKHIGHKVNNKLLTLFDVCYDNNGGEAVYADHVLYGSAIAYAKSVSSRPSFKVGGLASGVNADNSYKQATQKTTFTTILNSSALADKYIYSNSYLARGHLAPDADQVYITSSYSTYFYINTVPQWQQVNNGNWKSVEGSIRTLASQTSETYRIITGGYDVLQFNDVNNNPKPIYLSNDKLPAPKFTWKVLYSLDSQKGIAFVTLNNPFIDTVSTSDYICTDLCADFGWGTSAWSTPSKGLTYCCDVDELRGTVNTIPDLDILYVQEGPNSFK